MEGTSLTIPILVGAALIDSINPCAFGVLIFLLTYLFKSFKSHKHVLVHGLVYIFGVFITYLVAGLLLLPILQQFGRTAAGIYLVIGGLLLLFGVLEIKDFFFYGRGPTLAIWPSAARRIEYYVSRITDRLTTSFFLGVFVALVELPCTGAVYLGVLALVSLIGLQISTFSMLVIYNLIFVLPLIVILFLIHSGGQINKYELLREKYRRHMRLLTGIVLLALGGWMIRFIL